jgi:peroxiredoxin
MIVRPVVVIAVALAIAVACKVKTEGPRKPRQEGEAAWIPTQKKFASAIAVGSVVPEFDLASVSKDQTGRVKLVEMLGRRDRVLLVFYRGDWCPFCRTQLEELQKYLAELDKRNADVVAISVDPVETNLELSARLGLTFPLAADPEHATLAAFGVYDDHHEIAWPAVFIVERDRRVSWRYLADDYKVRPTVEEMLRALDDIAVTKPVSAR